MSKSGAARSLTMKLSALAREKRVSFQKILTEFLIERMLARLVNSKKLAAQLIFKGGYVGRRAYGSPRYTIDLDALLRSEQVASFQKMIIESVEVDLDDSTWFRFEETQDLHTQGEYPGVRFVFRSGIGTPLINLKKAQIINFDIGVGDYVQPVELNLIAIINEEIISWTVYSREGIVAEKLHSFLSRPLGNSRSKDLFDLMYYLPHCEPPLLREATRGTFAMRGDILPEDIIAAFQSLHLDTLKRGWVSAVSDLDGVGSFEEVFKKVIILLKEKL